jgi:hypothetical protein
MGKQRRTRSVGTKLTEEEYAKLEALAAQRGVTPGECVRDPVLGAFGESRPEATPTEQALLSEVLALRTMLINRFPGAPPLEGSSKFIKTGRATIRDAWRPPDPSVQLATPK